MPRTNATGVIEILKRTFALFGPPVEVILDQGPVFTSREFQSYLNNNGIFLARVSSGVEWAAENAVKLCKGIIKKGT